MKRENDQLKRLNENLRITNATLRTKPGRAELRLLHVYDTAIQIMSAKAPGFGAVWQGIIAEVESCMQETDQGKQALVTKGFRPSALLERLSEWRR